MSWPIFLVILISCVFVLGLSGCLLNAYYMQKKQLTISDKDWQSYMAFAWTSMSAAILTTVSAVAYGVVRARSKTGNSTTGSASHN